MSFGKANPHDPRARLVREKYFSVRPKPLERWLWSKDVPASAERVFWLHWQEGQQRGDWCSEIPLRRVAQECDLDVSTVTRAYQCLMRLDCIRRTDPGRDPANPFQQATAVTEVRIPAELLQSLHRYPNRRQPTELSQTAKAGRAEQQSTSPPRETAVSPAHSQAPSASAAKTPTDPEVGAIPLPAAIPVSSEPANTATSTIATQSTATPPADLLLLPPAHTSKHEQVSPPPTALTGRNRARAIAEITALLSPTERDAYHSALRLHRPTMTFDTTSKIPAEKRALLEATLATLAADANGSQSAGSPCSSTAPHSSSTPHGTGSRPAHPAANAPQRKLSLFQIARLKRDIQSATSSAAAPELVRQVMWSIEAGALRRFSPLHALNIAVKKIREGSWTRPHRMPPNWARSLSTPNSFSASTLSVTSSHEACSAA